MVKCRMNLGQLFFSYYFLGSRVVHSIQIQCYKIAIKLKKMYIRTTTQTKLFKKYFMKQFAELTSSLSWRGAFQLLRDVKRKFKDILNDVWMQKKQRSCDLWQRRENTVPEKFPDHRRVMASPKINEIKIIKK